MDDVAKAAGFAMILGALAFAAIIGVRVYHDPAMVWFILATGAAIAVLGMVALVLVLVRRADEARRWTAETNLTQARVIRTLGDMPNRPALGSGADLLGSLIAGMPGADTVDVAPAASGPQWEDDD